MPSVAAANRFLRSHVGDRFLTRQVADGRTWEPGPRTLDARPTFFLLDGSRLNLSGLTCEELTDRSVTFVYPPEWGDQRVTYTLDDDDDDA